MHNGLANSSLLSFHPVLLGSLGHSVVVQHRPSWSAYLPVRETMDELGDEEAEWIIRWTMGKGMPTRTKNVEWLLEVSPDNQDDQE